MFLFMNVASCFIVTDVVTKIGLQRAVQGAAVLMAIGCWLRSGLGFAGPAMSMLGMAGTTTAAAGAAGLVPYPLMVAGTLLVGFAQPFFQCTPPVLSAQWFAPDERATSTAVALNFNQIGIATAFLVGGAMATNAAGMEQYFGLVAVISTLVAIGSALQFQSEPPIPPSTSELEKKISGHVEPPFLESVQQFFKTKGFSRALAAFVCSISITNIVGVSLRSRYLFNCKTSMFSTFDQCLTEFSCSFVPGFY
jgi:FLVCR family feline leukemia virus subgroup C receptor-related protein